MLELGLLKHTYSAAIGNFCLFSNFMSTEENNSETLEKLHYGILVGHLFTSEENLREADMHENITGGNGRLRLHLA